MPYALDDRIYHSVKYQEQMRRYFSQKWRRELDHHTDPSRPWTHPPTEAENAAADRIETYLETLETSGHHRAPARLDILRAKRRVIVRRYLSVHKPGQDLSHVSALLDCESVYKVYTREGVPEVHPQRCRRRDCPVCHDYRRKMWRSRIQDSISIWSAPKHVVLTLKSSTDPLGKQLDRLLESFRELRRRTKWKKRTPWGMYVVEISFNQETCLWHPHLHVICNMAFLHWADLKHMWQEITGDSWDCSISAVNKNLANYVAGYVSKSFSCFEEEVSLFELMSQLKGRRLVSKFGRWPKLPTSKPAKLIFRGTVAQVMKRALLGDPEAAELVRALQSSWGHKVWDHYHPDLTALYPTGCSPGLT